MKQLIEAILRPLVGTPLTYMMRYVGFQRFEFGVQRSTTDYKGDSVTIADWRLVVSCQWQITGPDGPVVGSEDFGPARERRDEGASWFYDLLKGEDAPRVERIEADLTGGVHFELTNRFAFEIIPRLQDPARWEMYENTRQGMSRDGEMWRLFPESTCAVGPGHFVVTTDGIEDGRDAAFFEAILDDDQAAVRDMIALGIHPEYNPEEESQATLEYAAIESSPEMVQLLMSHGIGAQDPPPMIAAARGGHIETVRSFHTRGGDVNERDEIGWTPLMEAASWGSMEIVRFLVENGADVHCQTNRGNTAIRVARHDEQTEVIAYLESLSRDTWQ